MVVIGGAAGVFVQTVALGVENPMLFEATME